LTSLEAEALALPQLATLLRVDRTRADGAILQLADERRVHQVVNTWVPLLMRMGTEDAHWKWAEKATDVCYTTGVEHVMIMHEDEVHGVMITSLPDSPPPLSSLHDLLYVEYLAVAPWNRSQAGDQQRFKGIGPLLLGHAVRRSRSKERQGHVGLHSEPRAITFYDGIRLRRCGPDPDQERRQYFEGDAAWADRFLAGR
jgi:hypothetical protein